MTPLDITHRWTWTGGRNIPDWLDGHHHWHHDRPVIHTVDGPRTLCTGWLVALWTDGVITVGSNTVADRVYGPDGLAGRLQRAEQRADEAEQRLKNIAAGLPRADSIQAEIGEMILQTHELRDQLRDAEADRDRLARLRTLVGAAADEARGSVRDWLVDALAEVADPREPSTAFTVRQRAERAEARARELELHLREADAENLELAAHNDRTCEAVQRRDVAEAAVERIRQLAARIRQGVPWAANFDDLADRILGALGGEERGESCSANSPETEPNNVRTGPAPDDPDWNSPEDAAYDKGVASPSPGPAATQATDLATGLAPARPWSTCTQRVDHGPHPWQDPWPLPHGQDAHCPGWPTPEPIVTVHTAPSLSPEAAEALGALAAVAKRQIIEDTAGPACEGCGHSEGEGCGCPPAPPGLRARLAHTLRTTPTRTATAGLGFPDHHSPGEPGYLGWCALCTRDVDALTEALLAAVTGHLDVGDAQAWCKTCRRAWNSPAHRCESDGEQRVQQIAELRDQWLMAGAPPLGTSINRWVDKRLVEFNAALDGEPPGPA